MWQNLQWVVQNNLTNRNDVAALQEACQKWKIPFVKIDIIPFSFELPVFERNNRSIFYGSTTLNALAYEDLSLRAGIFFDPVSFSMERYLERWGEHMLNYGARVITIDELIQSNYDPEQLLFIRPNDDGKSFAGEVVKFGDCTSWFEKLKEGDNAGVSLESRIVVGEPYHIGREWRLWCVNKKVIAFSQYRNNFKLDKRRDCPVEVIRYAEKRCLEYMPHDVFVMDVCECGGRYYVIECNCMNAAGFYNGDIAAIVYHVSSYLSHFFS